ncbi:V-type ATPase, D subunit [Thalassoporum mexicanum PCC 7367]|uniref:V-type ATP synthase subunit D n=1 Tax=Thalassoporum mexicanum TaxID=3457544 RepID=UPI00029FF0E5|nr:V-type ATP synthase subunit D [Pseudanabaena sp. PCC 7367]AFY68370.1 V-type ATPase, D subunit [Pseudanabaena sp. PCC 7367]
MAKVALNKSSLKNQKDQKDTYQKFLPSLDLKKQQLQGEAGKARRMLSEQKQRLVQYQAQIDDWVALLGDTSVQLHGLVRLKGWETRNENVAGVILPVLGEINFVVHPYTTLGAPLWFDNLVESLQEIARMTLQVKILEERVEKLDAALKKVTQRINLFEKVLIPECQKNIRMIKIYLEDKARTAVARSKIAKSKLTAKSSY